MMSEIYYLYHIFYICSVAYPNVLDKYISPNVESNWFSACCPFLTNTHREMNRKYLRKHID